MDRDTDWILAIGHAVGLEAGVEVPAVPEPKVVKAFLDEYFEHRLRQMVDDSVPNVIVSESGDRTVPAERLMINLMRDRIRQLERKLANRGIDP